MAQFIDVEAYRNYYGELLVGLTFRKGGGYDKVLDRADATKLRDALSKALATEAECITSTAAARCTARARTTARACIKGTAMTEHDTDRAPVAKCAGKSCVRFLNFERNWIGEVVCSCPACEDAEYDPDRGFQRCDPVGFGKTAAEAFADYCEVTDMLPDELLVEGEQHV
jgi:hypothetical protein